MKTIYVRLLQLLLVCSCQFSFAQWTSSALPDINELNYTFEALVSSGNRLIVGTSNGIYVSDNEGAQWQPIYNGVTTSNITCMINEGQAIIAGGQYGRVFVSSNNGNSWQTVTNGIFAGSNISKFALQGSTVLAISEDNKLYTSQDHGQSWQQNSTAPAFTYINVFVKGSKIFLTGTAGNVYSSSDNGTTWQLANSGLPSAIINTITTDGTNLWAATETPISGGVYKSTDDGATWRNSWNGVPGAWMGNVLYLPSSGKLIANTKSMGYLYSSLDGGTTWTNIGRPFTYIRQHVVQNGHLFAASWQNGIYYSDNDAQTWTAANRGFEAVVSKLFKIEGNVYGAGTSLNYVTSDEAQTWTNSSLPQYAHMLTTYKVGTRTYAGTGLGLFYTEDNGANWTQVVSPDLPTSNFEVRGIAMNGTTMYLATNLGVYVSTNLTQWQTLNNGFSSTDIYKIAVSSSGKLFALNPYTLYESVNNGQSWVINSSMAAQSYNNFYFYDDNLYLIGQSLNVSTNGGVSFTTINKPAAVSNILDFKIYNDIMFVVGTNNNVFVSYNQGATWSTFSTGLTSSAFFISSIQFTDNYIVISTNGPFDVFRRPISDLAVTCPAIGDISGPASVCSSQSGVSYSIPSQTGVTYNWSATGATIASGNGTSGVQINFMASQATITVIQSKVGCADQTASVQVNVNAPAAASISGPSSICENATGTYSVATYPNATYQWTAPAGATITGQGTETVGVTFAVTSGNVLVDVVSNGCAVPQATMSVAINKAPVITSVGGPTIMCANQPGNTYQVTDVNSPSTTYAWTVSTGASIDGSSTTSTVQISMGNVGGVISVQGTNECGVSSTYNLNVNVETITAPLVTGVSDIATNQTGVVYSIPAVPNVTYKWEVPLDATVVSGHGTNQISVNFGTFSGDISVTHTSTIGCGEATTYYPVTVGNIIVRPTASVRLSTICGGYIGEFYNLTGTFPLTVVLTDNTNAQYEFVLASSSDNTRLFAPNKTYTIVSVTDANGITSSTGDVSGSFTTSAATMTTNPIGSYTGNCWVELSCSGSGLIGGTYEWFSVDADGNYTSLGNDDFIYYAVQSGRYVATYHLPNGCYRQSNPVNITLSVTAPAVPVVTPTGPVNVPCGQSVNVTLNTPSGFSYYRWYKNGNLVSSNNLNTYIATSTGDYAVSISNDNVCYTTFSLPVTITQPAQPVQAPALTPNGGVFIPCGKSTILSVANYYLFGFNYFKWFKDGVLIPGANLPTLSISQPGSYTVQGSLDGSCYSALSAMASASIQINNGIGINTSTGTSNMACGNSMDLVATSGYASYRWYKDGVVIPGVSGNILSPITDAGKYEVETYNATCISAKVARDIYVGTTPPIFVLPPVNPIISCGTTTTVTTPAVSAYYRWYRNGVIIPNSNSNTISVSSTGDYSVSASSDGNCYTVPSNPAHVDVVFTGVTPSLSLSKTPISCGEVATLIATPSNYAYYKWYLNNQEYTTTTSRTLQITTQGQYKVSVSNDNVCYSVVSSAVSLTITAQTATLQINNGETTFGYAYNSGNNTLQTTGGSASFDSYQWQFNQYFTGTDNWVDIPGATAASHDFTDINGRYRLKGMYNGCPASYSNVISVFINNFPLDIYPSQTNAIMCSNNAKLTTTAGYQNYAWTNMTTNAPIAVTTVPELILANYNLGSGIYRVTAYGTDQHGVQYTNNSANTRILVYTSITPVLSVPTLACAGTSGTLQVNSPSGVYSSYEWKDNLNAIVGTNSALLVSIPGTYTLNVIDYAGCSATVIAPVTGSPSSVDFTPVLVTQNGSTQFCIGGNTTIRISNTASMPAGSYEYRWYKNGLFLSSGTSNTLTVTTAGTYSLQMVPQSGTTACIGYSNTIAISNSPIINTTVQVPLGNKFCIGMGQKLMAASGPGYTYQWGTLIASPVPPPFFMPIDGATGQEYEPTFNQQVVVRITDANGCIATSSTIPVQMSPSPDQPVIRLASGLDNPVAPAVLTTCSTQVYLSAVRSFNDNLPLLTIARWYKDGQLVSSGKNFTAVSSGIYTLEYAINNCAKISSPLQINFTAPPSAVITFLNVSPVPTGPVISSCSSSRTIFKGPDAPIGMTYTYKWFALISMSQSTSGLTPVSTAQQFTPTVSTLFYKLEVNNGSCSTLSSTYQILTTPAPSTAPTATERHLCGAGAVTFTANGTLQTNWKYRWTEIATGTIAQESTSNTFTTPSLSTNTSYSVEYVNGTCPATVRTTTTAFIHTPVAPTVQNVSRCGPGSVTLTASGNSAGMYVWYTSSTASAYVATGANYTTPTLTTGATYYAASYETVNSQLCYGTRVPVNVVIKTIPIISVTSSVTNICKDQVVTLTASGADSYVWKSGTTQLGTNATYSPVTSTPGSISYVVEGTKDGCIGSTNYNAVIYPLPMFNVISSNGTTICANTSTVLRIVGGTDNRFWYVSPFTTHFSTAASVQVTPTATTTYVAAVVDTRGCRGERTVPVNVISAPAAPVVNAIAPVCSLQVASITIQSSSATLTYRWYDENNILVYTGTTYSPVINRDRVFKVVASNGSCASPVTTVNIHMIQVVAAPNYSGEVCGTTNVGFPVQPNVTGQRYDWFNTSIGGTSLGQGIYYTSVVTQGSSKTFYAEASKTESGVTCRASTRGVVTVAAVIPIIVSISSSQTEVCFGSYVDLTATGAETYSWSHNLGNMSTVRAYQGGVNADRDVTYSVTGHDYPCMANASITIHVKKRPELPTITSNKEEVCGAEQVIFTGSGATGTQRYVWSSYFPSPNDKKTSTSPADNQWSIPYVGSSPIRLSILDDNGCSSSQVSKQLIGYRPSSLYFDGTDDRITIPVPAHLPHYTNVFNNEGNDFTLAVKLKYRTTQNQVPAIISKRTNDQNGYLLTTTNDGRRIVLQINGYNYQSSIIPTLYDDRCHEIGATVRLTSSNVFGRIRYSRQVRLYLDGNLVGTVNHSNITSVNEVNSSFIIGNDFSSRPFGGTIYDVKLWTSRLTTADMLATYNGSLTAPATTIIYRLDEYQGQTVTGMLTSNTGLALGVLGFSNAVEPSDPVRICQSECSPVARIGEEITEREEVLELPLNGSMNASPNPFEYQTSIHLEGFESESVTLTVRDLNGKELWRKEKHPVMEIILIGEGLNSGIFILQVIGENESEIQTLKIIKTK